MNKVKRMAVFALAAGIAGATLYGDVSENNIAYALEDAAFQAVMKMNSDPRVGNSVTNVAFVKMWFSDGTKTLKPTSNESIVFESALAATPGKLRFVVHSSHDSDWALIDEIFDQAADFDSWNPKTCPKLKQLKLCDAILTAQLRMIPVDTDTGSLRAPLSLRLIRVSTAEVIWAGNVEGSYSNPGPDNEKVSPQWRHALESCAADAVSRLPPSLNGYGLLILPIEGPGGKALGQVFLNALTAAGLQDKIRVYDLPNGNASDRMLGRFLRERAGMGVAVDDSVLKRIETISGGDGIRKAGKLALMTGYMAVVNESPKFQLDPYGLPVDFLDGQAAAVAEARKRHEVTADFKFRDVNDHFRLIGAIGARGVYEPPEPPPPPPPQEPSAFDKFLNFIGMDRKTFLKMAVGAAAVLLLLVFIAKILKGLSRPR